MNYCKKKKKYSDRLKRGRVEARAQLGDCGRSGLGAVMASWSHRKWSDVGFMLKVEPAGFADGFEVGL